MTSSVDRARPFYLAASAAVLLATSFGAGRVLSIENAGNKNAFVENPNAGVDLPDLPTIVPTPGASPTTTAAPELTTTTAAPATTPTTAANIVCRWTSKILKGGIAGPLGVGPSDQFTVTVTNSEWSGKEITYRKTYTAPAVLRRVIAMPATTARADSNGTVTFTLPIGPESQGGTIAVLTEVVGNNANVLDVCGWQQFTVDYNGPAGLVGGIANSAAKLLNL